MTEENDHDCTDHIQHDQTADVFDGTRYEDCTCRICGREMAMVWSYIGIQDKETGEYLEE